jgi:DNA-binding NarL/FixJ family response regulator
VTEAAVISVLVVDDHQTFAELLALALDAEPALRYVGHARSSAEAERLVTELAPDVVLMDVQLPDVDGITTTERLVATRPELRVVILTAHTDPSLVTRAAASGASGFLPKDGSLRDVLQALHTAHRGGMVIPATLLAGALRPRSTAAEPGPGPGAASLTSRECDVLRLMGRGMDVRAISRDLGISPHTCRGYVKSILAKLGAHTQLEAVMTAIRLGVIAPEEPA